MLDHLDIEGLIRMTRSHQSCHRHKTKISFLNWEIVYIYHKVGCVFPMIIVSILPQAEIGPNDHREDASHFRI